MPTPEQILELARAIRPYLPDLLPQPTATKVDQTLENLLAEADSNSSTPLLIQKCLRSHEATREWANKFLGDPEFADTHRQYNPLASQPSVILSTPFKCPECHRIWFRSRVGEEIPLCPIHNIPFKPMA